MAPFLDKRLNASQTYQDTRRAHWDHIASSTEPTIQGGAYYHRRLAQIYQFLIPAGLKVLELGCEKGDLLAAVHPSNGVGIDFSSQMIARAQHKHPELHFIQMDAHEVGKLAETFDVIILSDLVGDAWDVQQVLEQVLVLSHKRTRVIINSYSRVWELPLALLEKLGLARPNLYQNWLTKEDISGMLNLAGFEVIRMWPEILFPLPIPIVSTFANQFLAKIWPTKLLDLTNFILARPRQTGAWDSEKPSVSVIVPARNEAGNIPQIFERLPEMGCWTELIFVEGHSSDQTYAAIENEIARHPNQRCKLIKQTGSGKGDAVRAGFSQAEGDILMILDADLTVPPEDLPRFYHVLLNGLAEFVNGVRLVYPMEKEAMRFLNLSGNKFFSLAFSWLLGQNIKDTLCGTKVLWKADYEQIAKNRSYFGDFDPFGDFDLLFGASKLGLKIHDLPIRYKERTYGTTNISRWKHGWLLLRMVVFAAFRVKFQ